ncbi:MAG: Potassium-transporting ATPase C chain [Pelotomaculum sp. PtaB.Bin013]|uniref:potassium-transporting ATPase subunit C n=1 Tax=Pelotomaculum isophthalicicum TaxID=342448 RepID=UPI0009C9487A|nr:potassium-transporting ATPase subunit C [Pelotomaculum isophthalicicum]OPX91890.1 MAG: Potassium-transporting ATPase C chain [Pelotomaculum sp. PtaB.Bin013]
MTGIVYPLTVTGLAQVFFPHQANGSVIYHDGEPVGSALIGQNFMQPEYFHGYIG